MNYSLNAILLKSGSQIKKPLAAVVELIAVPGEDPLLELKYPHDPSLDHTHGHIPERSSIVHPEGNPFPKSSLQIVSPVLSWLEIEGCFVE